MHPDDTTLLNILAKRSDLTRPRPQEHFFFLPTEEAARELVGQLEGWTQVGDVRPVDGTWALTIQRTDLPANEPTITGLRKRFTELALDLGGLYDGWQATTDVGLDRPADGSAMLLEELDPGDRDTINQLVPLLKKLGALHSPEALVTFIDAGRPEWKMRAFEDPATADDVIHLVGTAAGEQIAAATGLRWVLLVEDDMEEIVLADAERGVIRPFSMASEWWEEKGRTDVADFIRAAIMLIQN